MTAGSFVPRVFKNSVLRFASSVSSHDVFMFENALGKEIRLQLTCDCLDVVARRFANANCVRAGNLHHAFGSDATGG